MKKAILKWLIVSLLVTSSSVVAVTDASSVESYNDIKLDLPYEK
ncbi:hypothetical protein [Salipaludibacillus daqingensis]|nr:hypothetical protein [Salipaludibacillus daqingensis]